MPALADLKHNMRELALKAHAIVEDEKLTGAEKREALDKYDADIKSLSEDIKNEEYLVEQRKSLGDIIGAETPSEEEIEQRDPETLKSLGEQLVSNAEFKSFIEQTRNGAQGSSGVMNLKTTFSESGLTSANVIAQDRRPGILPILFQRLTVADLMPNTTTNSNVVRYVVESTATNAASTVAEGGTKPEAALNLNVVDESVKKIAVILKVTDEMLEDLDQAAGYVNGRLSLFVQQREEQQLLTGASASLASNINGILNRSITAADPVGSETYGKVALAVHREITKIRVASFLDPDALVFHPNDWQAARFEADANGQFFGGGPFTGAYGVNGIAGDTYWGLPVVNTQAMTENTILIGAFRTAAQIFRRNNITVTMTNSNEDDFKNNLVAVRAEERLALAVYRPSAFGTVTGA